MDCSNRKIFQNRLESLRDLMRGRGIDALIVSKPENRMYLSGFSAEDPQRDEISAFIIVTLSEVYLLTDSRYSLQAEKETFFCEIIIIKESIFKEIAAVISEKKIKRVGFESKDISHFIYEKIYEELSDNVDLVPIIDMVEEFRKKKDEWEINCIKKALAITEDIFEELHYELKGKREKEISLLVPQLIYKYGGEGEAFKTIVASGPNAALPHAVPGDRVIKDGDMIIVDMGARFSGYCADCTRTFFVGRPDKRFIEIYNLVLKAQTEAIKAIRPGAYAKDIDSIARNIIKDGGYGEYFGHSLGHGVGLATHEEPNVGQRSKDILEKGMVITVEPGIYIPSWGGVRLENMVLVTQDGAEVLNKTHLIPY